MMSFERYQCDPRLSVLVVCHYFPPHVGGIEEVARAEAEGLASEGLSVAIVTSSPGASSGPDPVHPGIRIIRVPAANILERFGVPFPLFFLPTLLSHLWNEIRRADVVHIHDTLYLSSWIAALLCRLLRTPLVVTKHVAIVAHPSPSVAVVQRFVHGTVGRFICHSAVVVFYVNTDVRDGLVALGVPEQNLVALPNGVDLDTFAPPASSKERTALRHTLNLPTNRPLVLFVGRLVHKKGYRRLVEAADRQRSWIAVLAGDGDVVPPSPQIHPRGRQDRDTVRLLYRACDLFVLPSQSEGFPLTVQEAMASGLPIVTTDDPGYDMYGLDHSLVTLLGPERVLDDIIDALLSDPERCQRMAHYSRRFAEQHFSWEQHISTLRNAFDRAVLAPQCTSEHPRTSLVRP